MVAGAKYLHHEKKLNVKSQHLLAYFVLCWLQSTILRITVMVWWLYVEISNPQLMLLFLIIQVLHTNTWQKIQKVPEGIWCCSLLVSSSESNYHCQFPLCAGHILSQHRPIDHDGENSLPVVSSMVAASHRWHRSHSGSDEPPHCS